jgi:hypothetical protein
MSDAGEIPKLIGDDPLIDAFVPALDERGHLSSRRVSESSTTA